MKRVVAVTLLLLFAGSGHAEPRRTFTKITQFGECYVHDICGLGPLGYESQGKELRCNLYTFVPDGRYSRRSALGFASSGRYQLVGRTVRLTPVDTDGRPGKTRVIRLSADGKTLDGLKRRASPDALRPRAAN